MHYNAVQWCTKGRGTKGAVVLGRKIIKMFTKKERERAQLNYLSPGAVKARYAPGDVREVVKVSIDAQSRKNFKCF